MVAIIDAQRRELEALCRKHRVRRLEVLSCRRHAMGIAPRFNAGMAQKENLSPVGTAEPQASARSVVLPGLRRVGDSLPPINRWAILNASFQDA